jgi:predicted acetyltransferase
MEDNLLEIEIQPVSADDKSVLRNMMELYLYDFSEYDGADLNDHGWYGYYYLDNYWTEASRQPFFLRVSGKLAGFALVRDIEIEGLGTIHHMAEFFVMRKYRRRKAGTAFARALFDRLPGLWRVGEEHGNLPAQVFWRKVIGEYTGGKYGEISPPEWDGPMQEFEAS